MHIEVPEPLEELPQILQRASPKDLGFAIVLAAQSLRQVGNHFGQFIEERLLGQLDGLLKSRSGAP